MWPRKPSLRNYFAKMINTFIGFLNVENSYPFKIAYLD
jgi:hypothetical protein